MTNQEIKTITEAMKAKQSWVRKSLENFIEVWSDITSEDISGHKYFTVRKGSCDYDGTKNDIYLYRGSGYLNYAHPDYGYDYNNDKTYDVNNLNINTVREIIENIVTGLPKYFKNIQADIDQLSDAGRKINDIIAKLS